MSEAALYTPDRIPVVLAGYELKTATMVGLDRHLNATLKGLRDQHGSQNEWFDSLRRHTMGAHGECCIAKTMNVYWNFSQGTFMNGGDVQNWLVRTRGLPKRPELPPYQLSVHPNEPNDREMFFVRLIEQDPRPIYEVVGTIMVGEAKRPRWLANHGGGDNYFVPDEYLLPIRQRRGY